MSYNKYNKTLGVTFHKDLLKKTDREKPVKEGFWKKKLVEFCKRTDLHGYKYIVMDDLNRVERSCWALAVLLSVVFAAYFVVTAYKWYARNPIVTVIESTQGAIWDIPFPAVTICDLNAVSRKAARAFANNVTLPQNITAEFVFETVRLSPLIHSMYITTTEQKERLYLLQQVLDLNKISLETMFRTLSPASSCSQLIERCMWKNTIYRCDHLFKQVFTVSTLCCTFNYYAVRDWDINKKVNPAELYQLENPRRVASCGYQTALTVLLKTDPDDYHSATVASQGSLVFIDSAYNIPNHDSPVRMVNPSSEVLIALSPESTYTTSGIKAFSPEERQCYYSDEVPLGEFHHYSLHNCIATQIVEIIMKTCECVPFYFPVKGPKKELRASQLDRKTKACLPECEHYDYPIEVAMGKLAKHVKLTGLPFFKEVNLENRSLLNVFFNDLVSTRYRRDVYFNWQNFSAAFGGLLSLMLGFTLISGCDLILFFTLRLAYESLPKYKDGSKKTKSINENDLKVNNWIKQSMQHRHLTDQEYGIWRQKNAFVPRY